MRGKGNLLGLGEVTGETVEQETVPALVLHQALVDQPNNQIIGDEVSALHDGLSFLSEVWKKRKEGLMSMRKV